MTSGIHTYLDVLGLFNMGSQRRFKNTFMLCNAEKLISNCSPNPTHFIFLKYLKVETIFVGGLKNASNNINPHSC